MNEEFFGNLKGGDAVAEYESHYRHPNLTRFKISPPVDLFPMRPLPSGITPKSSWTDNWPFAWSPGVYMIYSESLDLMYIGKASMNRYLGQRLGDYFGGSTTCIPKKNWLQTARFVINIAVPEETPFEAPALEEFLIKKLQPPWNAAGK
jgi:hypothetical protein